MAAGDDSKTWIAAQAALALLTGGAGVAEDQAKETLIQGAASGLVAARCRRLRWEPQFADKGSGTQKDDAEVPPPFWVDFLTWPDNRKAENWAFGNFSVYSSDRYSSPGYMHTLGVEFAEAEVRSFLPPGPRAEPWQAQRAKPPPPASSARSVAPRDWTPEVASDEPSAQFDVDPAEFEGWVTPGDVLKRLGGWNETNLTAIAHRIQDGYLTTAARRVTLPKVKHEYFELLNGFYKGWGFLADPSFWKHGDTEMWNKDSGRDLRGRAYGVKIKPVDLAKEFPDLYGHKGPSVVSVTLSSVIGGPVPQPSRPSTPATKSAARTRALTDEALVDWYRRWLPQNPRAVHHVTKRAAEGHFKGFSVGKNQLHRAMKAVQGKLNRGNPAIYRANREITEK
jgi:hypothetical protein